MKQILIRHTDDIAEDDALFLAYRAWKCSPDKTGIVVFSNNHIVAFSDRSKYPSMVVVREEKK